VILSDEDVEETDRRRRVTTLEERVEGSGEQRLGTGLASNSAYRI